MDGVLVVDKPSGPTSHDAVDRVRRALGLRRVGHTGTLDPFATGVLPMCLGKATRLARFLAEGDKEYRATVRLGFATATDDHLGAPLGEMRPVSVDLAAVRGAASGLIGPLLQVPPAYSAKRVDGRRLYDLARRGVAVAPAPVPVVVHALDVLGLEHDRVEIHVRCAPGTYVRALARDLGTALGVGGHLVALRRTRSGAFGLDDAVAWDELTPAAAARVIGLDGDLLADLPAVRVNAEGVRRVRHGNSLVRAQVDAGFPEAEPPPRVRLLDSTGVLLALAVPRGFGAAGPGLSLEPMLHPDVVLVD